MKFFCLLLYHFAFRRHWQILRHHLTKGDFSNIAVYFAFWLSINDGGESFFLTPTTGNLPLSEDGRIQSSVEHGSRIRCQEGPEGGAEEDRRLRGVDGG